MDSSEFELGKMMEVDSIIAQHMLELSHEDREKAYLDLHGVSNKIEETPELITRALDLMDLNIRSEHEKDAYNLAESLDATYVQNVAFRLKFLRGERFDSFMAAEKLLKHFELKKKLFGVAKLVKNITMDDMCKDSIEVLYNGIVQWLPMKDPSGRTVSILFPGYSQIKKSVECRMRASFYLRMIAMEDITVQKKGFVTIITADNMEGGETNLSFWKNSVKQMVRLHQGLPGSLHGTHVVIKNLNTVAGLMFSYVIQMTAHALNPLLKIRMRIHKGTNEEILSSLQSYGIPTNTIPQSPSDNKTFNSILNQRKMLEEEKQQQLAVAALSTDSIQVSPDSNNICVCTPGPLDVIFGRGHTHQNHTGNVKIRGLVEDSKAIYDSSSKKQKTIITEKVVHAIKKTGRFLKEGEAGGWVEVNDHDARLKVSHAFRDQAKREKARKVGAPVKAKRDRPR